MSLRRTLTGTAATVCIGAVIAATQGVPPDPQIFRAGTTLIPVDVRVVDKHGKPVTDLTQSDFTILEDGVPQRIGHFSTQAFTPQPPPALARPRRASDAFEIVSQNQRTFLIVLGRGRLQSPSDGVDAMLHLVRDRLLPQDLVAVMGWNRATDFTTDHGQALAVLDRFKRAHEGIEAQIVLWSRSLAAVFGNGDLPEYIQRDIDLVFGGPRAENSRTLGDHLKAAGLRNQAGRVADGLLSGRSLDPVDQVEADRLGGNLDDFLTENEQIRSDITKLYLGIEYLRHLAGEKHLVFLSEYGIALPKVEDDRDLGRAAADARVVIDVIHAGGVAFGSSGLSKAPGFSGLMQAATARNLIALTGGQFFAHQFPSASMDADMFDQSSRFQYVLGYYPERAGLDGKFRKITVKLGRPGLTVLSRAGYYARRELPAFDRRKVMVYSRVAGAAAYDKPIPDLRIGSANAVATMSGKSGSVKVDLTIDVSRVAFEKVNGRNVGSLEVAVFGVTARQETVGQEWQTLVLTYSDDRLGSVLRDGLHHALTIPITMPINDVKIVVYDYGADLVGTVVAKVSVAEKK